MYDNRPIGIFDSGIGGTSIWAAIHELLPNEKTIYWKSSMCGAGFYCGIKLDFVTHWMTHPDEPKVKA